MSIIKITGSGAYEQTQEKNHALEYLRRSLTAHKEKSPLDHPDGSVSEEKLSPELRERLKNNTESISNAENKLTDLEADSHIHTNKDILDSITETPPTQAELEALDLKVNNAASITIGLDESVPEETIPSICNFEIKPVTQDVYYSITNPVLLNASYMGMEVPIVTTEGDILVIDSNEKEKYRCSLPLMISSQGVSDKFTNDGLYKEWGDKFYINKSPESVTAVSGYYSWNPTNYIFEFNFTEEDFALTGLPPKTSNIPIVTTSFVNMTTDYILEGSADGDGNTVYGAGIARANLSWNEEKSCWVLLVRSNLSSTDYFSRCSKTYFYYQLETPYMDKSINFAMGLSSGDSVKFESKSDYSYYLSISNFLFADFKKNKAVTEIVDDVNFAASVCTSIIESLEGFSNGANILNNVNKTVTSSSTSNNYNWIGEGDSSTDYTTMIQKKLDEVHYLGGGTVYLGNGDYNISSHLIVYGNTNLVGDHDTKIIQTADNTHALILSGNNIEVRNINIKLSGACTQETGCIYVNSNNIETNEKYDSTYPINKFVQYITIDNVSFTGNYKFDWNGNYVVISDAYENYKGCGILCKDLYFNYAFVNNCRFSYLYAGVNGEGGSNQYNITCTESKIGVISTGGYNVINIFGHSYYEYSSADSIISMSDCVVRCTTGEVNTFTIRTYDEQWYKNIIVFEGLSMGNKYDIIQGTVSQSSNISDMDRDESVNEEIVVDQGRGNRAIAYVQSKPYHIGGRYKGLSNISSTIKDFNPVVDNALSGAGIWGLITSNIEFEENDISLRDICRYPKERQGKTINGIPCVKSTISPDIDNPIEIEIDLSNRPVKTFPNLFIQFHNSNVASDFTISFDTNGTGYDYVRTVSGNTDILYYIMDHQHPITNIYKIKISFTKALQIENYQYQTSDYTKYSMNYNEENLIGICNIGMVGDDYCGRSFLGECGGSLYGNVDMHNNTFKNVATPTESNDAVNKGYVDDGLTSKADKSDLDSINNIINKNFELIATQTVSPDTDGSLPNAIEFSVDDNGEPFELTDFFIIAKTGVNGSSTVRLLVNDHGIWGNASIEGFNQATATRLWNIQYISFGEDNGGVVFCSRQTSLNSHPNSNIYTDYVVRIPPKLLFSNVSHINSIKKIQLGLITTTVTFVEGSTFELWGVKKK